MYKGFEKKDASERTLRKESLNLYSNYIILFIYKEMIVKLHQCL